MHDETPPERSDVKALWRDQPEELQQPLSSETLDARSKRLSAATRSEILASLGAVLFFAAVVGWRLGLDRIAGAGLAAVGVWLGITLYWFRKRVWQPRRKVDSKALTAPGIEFYSRELEDRRRHLTNPWLWHGPLLLACGLMAAVAVGTSRAFDRLLQVWPLLLALLIWVAFGIWRRRLEARAITRELDELARQ